MLGEEEVIVPKGQQVQDDMEELTSQMQASLDMKPLQQASRRRPSALTEKEHDVDGDDDDDDDDGTVLYEQKGDNEEVEVDYSA